MSATAVKWAYAQSGLSGPQKSILAFMSWRAEEDTFLAWPSVSTIANSTSLGLRTVKRSISELVDLGYLLPAGTRKTRCAMDGKYRETNQYQIPVQASFVDKATGKREEIDVSNWCQSDTSKIQLVPESPPTGATAAPNILSNKQSIYIYKGDRITSPFEVEIPPEVSREQIEQFVQHRINLRKSKKNKMLTQRVVKLAITEMVKLVRQGENLDACLNTMEMKGWDQPYPERKETRHENTSRNTRKPTVYDKLAETRRRLEQKYGSGNQTQDDGCIIEGEFFPC